MARSKGEEVIRLGILLVCMGVLGIVCYFYGWVGFFVYFIVFGLLGIFSGNREVYREKHDMAEAIRTYKEILKKLDYKDEKSEAHQALIEWVKKNETLQ